MEGVRLGTILSRKKDDGCIFYHDTLVTLQYISILTWLRGFQVKHLYLVVLFVAKSLLGIEGQKKLEIFAILTPKPLSHA